MITWRGKRKPGWRGAWAIVTGLILTSFIVDDFAFERTRRINKLISDTAAHLNRPLAEVAAIVHHQVLEGRVRFVFNLGIRLALLGAICAVAGGLLSLRPAREPEPDPP